MQTVAFGQTHDQKFIDFRLRMIRANHDMPRLFPSVPKRLFTIYAAVNELNGHIYIGLTSRSLEFRAKRHFYTAEAGLLHSHFKSAIRKYGKENFRFYEVVGCKTKEQAYEQERLVIEDLRPEYNSTAGGEGVLGHRMSAESRKKMRDAKMRRSDTRAIAIAAAMTLARPVICVTTGVQYASISEASRACGLVQSCIARLCTSGKPSRIKRLRFRFAEAS